jgi:hypothetical protein
MEALDEKYQGHLDAIKEAIQNSEILSSYLDTEEDEYYIQLQEYFEPAMQQVFDEVANSNPLQLEALENAFLDDEFEGLFLPKILGYSVLRGEINDNYKYRRPQDHFKDILLTICNSANFEMIKKRIGQTVQLGFALSSDIWITNIIASQSNKRVKAFLNSLRVDKFRELSQRKALYEKYRKQLNNVNFLSTQFPANKIELKSSFHQLRSFLLYRAQDDMDNTELIPDIHAFIKNKDLHGTDELFELLMIIGMSYDMDGNLAEDYKKLFATYVSDDKEFTDKFFTIYERLHEDDDSVMTGDKEQRFSKIISDCGSKEIKSFFEVMDEVHSKGFVHVDSIEAVSKYYERHAGMSLQNECLRASILTYISKFISNIEPENYSDYMEINKIVIAYISIFNNEKFNQEVKDVSLQFVKKCIKKFTDKKSKDYQDVKKYVTATYVDLGFLTPKQVVELFKTRRKPAAKK